MSEPSWSESVLEGRWLRAARLSALLGTRTWPLLLFNLFYVAVVLLFVVGSAIQGSPNWWVPLAIGVACGFVLLGAGIVRVHMLMGTVAQYLEGPMKTEYSADGMRVHSKLGVMTIPYSSVRASVGSFGFVALVRQPGDATIYLPEALVSDRAREVADFPRRVMFPITR